MKSLAMRIRNPVTALDILRKFWSYAVLNKRKSDLANALLGYIIPSGYRHQIGLDWYMSTIIPHDAPDFFFLVREYGWLKGQLEDGSFDEMDLDAKSTLEALTSIGDELIGVDGYDRIIEQLKAKISHERSSTANPKVVRHYFTWYGRRSR